MSAVSMSTRYGLGYATFRLEQARTDEQVVSAAAAVLLTGGDVELVVVRLLAQAVGNQFSLGSAA